MTTFSNKSNSSNFCGTKASETLIPLPKIGKIHENKFFCGCHFLLETISLWMGCGILAQNGYKPSLDP